MASLFKGPLLAFLQQLDHAVGSANMCVSGSSTLSETLYLQKGIQLHPPSNDIDIFIKQALSHNEQDLAVTFDLEFLEQKVFKEWNPVNKISHTRFRYFPFPPHAKSYANMERVEMINFYLTETVAADNKEKSSILHPQIQIIVVQSIKDYNPAMETFAGAIVRDFDFDIVTGIFNPTTQKIRCSSARTLHNIRTGRFYWTPSRYEPLDVRVQALRLQKYLDRGFIMTAMLPPGESRKSRIETEIRFGAIQVLTTAHNTHVIETDE
jgi:hypothetical protein